MTSTPNEVSQGNHDRTPYLLINNTYMSDRKIHMTSPVKNNPPGIPFSERNVERLGALATGAAVT